MYHTLWANNAYKLQQHFSNVSKQNEANIFFTKLWENADLITTAYHIDYWWTSIIFQFIWRNCNQLFTQITSGKLKNRSAARGVYTVNLLRFDHDVAESCVLSMIILTMMWQKLSVSICCMKGLTSNANEYCLHCTDEKS